MEHFPSHQDCRHDFQSQRFKVGRNFMVETISIWKEIEWDSVVFKEINPSPNCSLSSLRFFYLVTALLTVKLFDDFHLLFAI